MRGCDYRVMPTPVTRIRLLAWGLRSGPASPLPFPFPFQRRDATGFFKTKRNLSMPKISNSILFIAIALSISLGLSFYVLNNGDFNDALSTISVGVFSLAGLGFIGLFIYFRYDK